MRLLVLMVTYNFIVISHLFMHVPWFESRRLNALASALNSLIIGQSLQRHQLFHVRNHHRYNNDRKGADGKTKDLTSTFQNGEGGAHDGLFHYVSVGAVSMMGTTGRGLLSVTRLWRVGEHERELLELVAKDPARREQGLRQVRLDRLAHFAGVCVFLALSWRWTLFCYLPALSLAFVLVNLQNYFEHFGAAPESRYTDSVSYYGRLYNLLAFNDGYHQEHHLRPQVHWSLLPEVRRELTAQLDGTERVISPVPALLGFLHRDRPLLHHRPGGLSIPGLPRSVLVLLMSVLIGADTALASMPSEACITLDTCLARLVELSGTLERPDVVTEDYVAGESALIQALVEQGPEVVPEVAKLLQHPDVRVRYAAANVLGAFGEAAKAVLPALIEQMKAGNERAACALMRIPDPSALVPLLDSRERLMRHAGCRALAELGPRAAPAVPRLLEMLRSAPDMEDRECAVEPLGWIGSPEAVPALSEALRAAPSWRVQRGAAAALGRIGAREALPVLDEARRGHWFGPVRRAAVEARQAIEKRGAGPRPPHEPEAIMTARHEARDAEFVPPGEQCWDAGKKQWRVRKGERWLTLTPRAPSESRLKAKPPEGFPAVELPEYMPRSFEPVEEGWLVGLDKGEWGGELWLVTREGHKSVLAREKNLLGFARSKAGLLAFTGLAHLVLNEGAVHALTRAKDGTWTMRYLVELPAEPVVWKVDTDGGLVVATRRGGVVELTAAGALRMLTCR